MRKKLNPSSDTPLPLEDSAVTDPKIIPDVVQPSLFPELPEDGPVVASGAEVKLPKKAKSKPVVTPDPLPAEKKMSGLGCILTTNNKAESWRLIPRTKFSGYPKRCNRRWRMILVLLSAFAFWW